MPKNQEELNNRIFLCDNPLDFGSLDAKEKEKYGIHIVEFFKKQEQDSIMSILSRRQFFVHTDGTFSFLLERSAMKIQCNPIMLTNSD